MERKRRWRRLGALLTIVPTIPAVLLWSQIKSAFESEAAQSGMHLVVSLSARDLKVIEDGKTVHTYGVAVGRPSHPTPTGSFQTGEIIWNPAWNPPPVGWAKDKEPEPPGSPANPMQGVKIYFQAPYYYIHGTNDPGSIGEAASHGCIRMTPDDATALAHQIQRAGGSVPLDIKD